MRVCKSGRKDGRVAGRDGCTRSIETKARARLRNKEEPYICAIQRRNMRNKRKHKRGMDELKHARETREK